MSEIKLIIYIGNSLVFGNGIEDKSNTWAYKFAEEVGIDHVNLAISSKGNRWMVRKAYTEINPILKDRGLNPDQVLVLTMWGPCDFYEFYRGDRWQSLRPWDARNPEQQSKKHSPSHAKLFYKMFSHPEGSTIDTMVDWIGYESWIKAQGFRYGFMFGMKEVIMVPPSQMKSERTKAALEAYFGMVDKSKIMGGEIDPDKNEMMYVELVSEFPFLASNTDYGKHPLEEGHQHFLDRYFRDWAKKLLSGEI